MEFKCAERAENVSKKLEEAVSQLNEENYRLQRRDAEIIRLVLVFSLEKREYVGWKSLEVFDETCWRKSRLHAWLKRNTVIEKKSFCWVLIAENLLYTSDQNRQIRMVDSFSNTLGFEKKLIESISYSDSWTVFIVA